MVVQAILIAIVAKASTVGAVVGTIRAIAVWLPWALNCMVPHLAT